MWRRRRKRAFSTLLTINSLQPCLLTHVVIWSSTCIIELYCNSNNGTTRVSVKSQIGALNTIGIFNCQSKLFIFINPILFMSNGQNFQVFIEILLLSNGKTSKFSQNFYLKLLKKHTPIGCTIVSIKLAFYVCSPQVTNKNIVPLHFRQRKSQVLLLKSTSREWKEDLHDGYAPRKKKICACWPWGLRCTTPVSHVFFSDVLVIIKKNQQSLQYSASRCITSTRQQKSNSTWETKPSTARTPW